MKNLVDRTDTLKLQDDFELLYLMTNDQKKQSKLYKAGDYWLRKIKNTIEEIKTYGISSFRGTENAIGQSYTDAKFVDVRNVFSGTFIRRMARWFTTVFPSNIIYDRQVQLTRGYAHECNLLAQEILTLQPKTKELLQTYQIPYSLLGECFSKVTINDQEYSLHYLNLLEQHSNIAKHINFHKIHSVFEIGGGFGVNIHLLLENYSNIKKVLYLDIPPNLYIGTQYLKAFYGDSVIDYSRSKNLDSIKFTKDENLEIFCITPWQIENFNDSVDIFMNSHSFVEMPQEIVKNYADKVNKFPESENTAIVLVSYDYFDLNTTFHPDELPKFFNNKEFSHFESKQLLDSSRKNFFYVSANAFTNTTT